MSTAGVFRNASDRSPSGEIFRKLCRFVPSGSTVAGESAFCAGALAVDRPSAFGWSVIVVVGRMEDSW